MVVPLHTCPNLFSVCMCFIAPDWQNRWGRRPIKVYPKLAAAMDRPCYFSACNLKAPQRRRTPQSKKCRGGTNLGQLRNGRRERISVEGRGRGDDDETPFKCQRESVRPKRRRRRRRMAALFKTPLRCCSAPLFCSVSHSGIAAEGSCTFL